MSSDNDLLLGLDLGTTLIKAAVFDLQGRVVAVESSEVEVEFRKTGWAEQDPEHLWRLAAHVIKKCLKNHGIDSKRIVAVSLTGQMHGTFLVNSKGELARKKAIIWLDSRTNKMLNEF